MHLGDDIIESSKGISVPGISFLLHDDVPLDGYVMSFTTYYRNLLPATLQVWRPMSAVGNATAVFKLINSVTVHPFDDYEIEKVGRNGKRNNIMGLLPDT